MAQKKAHEVDGWARRPDWSHRIILVYGPDRGRVSDVAGMIAAASGVPLDDPFSTIKLDADAIEKEPGRLVDEARTVPMFSQARLVWIRGAANQKPLIDDLRDLIATPPTDAFIVVEAGELKKGAGLRSLVEGGGGAMALPCYADDNRGIDGLIDQEMTAAGLTIDPRRGGSSRRGSVATGSLARRDRQAGPLCPWHGQGDGRGRCRIDRRRVGGFDRSGGGFGDDRSPRRLRRSLRPAVGRSEPDTAATCRGDAAVPAASDARRGDGERSQIGRRRRRRCSAPGVLFTACHGRGCPSDLEGQGLRYGSRAPQ